MISTTSHGQISATESNLQTRDKHAERDIEKGDGGLDQDAEVIRSGLGRIESHVSQQDINTVANPRFVEANAAQYLRFTPRRKILITMVVSFCSVLAPISSTTILSAIPEVAEEYHSSGSVINISNALYLLFMGLSPALYGPISQVYGRRMICIICAVLFFAFSIGTALAPDLASYYVFRMFTAFQGTAFLIVGTAVLGDIYTPTERAKAVGVFLSGTLLGPAFGPFIGGIIVTYRGWRDVFWLQTALAGLGLVLVLFLLPETIPRMTKEDLKDLPRGARARHMWYLVNPFRIFILLFRYPNLLTAAGGSASLVWNMYSLLTPIRYVLDPRFHLDSPIQSGLFYIAPGCGYLLGTFLGGRWADHHVKVWIKRKGRRVPEDRLRSCLPFLGLVIPGSMLVYGWAVEKKVGGIALPVIAMFIQGVAQLFCFPSLNTYCLDVMQAGGRSAEVVASNYMIRYMFGAAGSAVVLPAIDKIGVGWFSTISALFMAACAVGILFTTWYGETWRDKVDARKQTRKAKQREQVPSGSPRQQPDTPRHAMLDIAESREKS